VTPAQGKVITITKYPVPTSKRELMCFLGMVGYYCKFCHNFSPETDTIFWSVDCQKAFERVKAVFQSFSVLQAPGFKK